MSLLQRCPHCDRSDGLIYAPSLKEPLSCEACRARRLIKEGRGHELVAENEARAKKIRDAILEGLNVSKRKKASNE